MDDDAVFRVDVARYLVSQGFDVSTCDTATEAKALWGEDQFDLVISDIFVQVEGEYMTDGGISLLGWLQSQRPVPIIAITGASDRFGERFLHNMKGLGAAATMYKPLDLEELRDEIAALLSPQAAGSSHP